MDRPGPANGALALALAAGPAGVDAIVRRGAGLPGHGDAAIVALVVRLVDDDARVEDLDQPGDPVHVPVGVVVGEADLAWLLMFQLLMVAVPPIRLLVMMVMMMIARVGKRGIWASELLRGDGA